MGDAINSRDIHRALTISEFLPQGWEFGWGTVDGIDGEVFVLSYMTLEWRFSECTFEEAVIETTEILESFEWN